MPSSGGIVPRTSSVASPSGVRTGRISCSSVWPVPGRCKSSSTCSICVPLEELIANQQQTNDLQVLPVALSHVFALQSLPAHHKGPFDRLLIAKPMLKRQRSSAMIRCSHIIQSRCCGEAACVLQFPISSAHGVRFPTASQGSLDLSCRQCRGVVRAEQGAGSRQGKPATLGGGAIRAMGCCSPGGARLRAHVPPDSRLASRAGAPAPCQPSHGRTKRA
jgi:hypothetical protein